MGAKPLTFLDYIANDKLKPNTIKEIVSGMVKACRQTGVCLVGGETAEMPDTYLPGEHDLVGVITGVVDKNKIINGKSIKEGDLIVGLPSNGLHTNGYSLARKIFFEFANFNINDKLDDLEKTLGLTLLEPHINYTSPVLSTLDIGINIKGIAHITGGGLIENIPRVLPGGLGAQINKGSWPILPIFKLMQSVGNIDENEMYKAFNMGIGMVFIIDPKDEPLLKNHLLQYNGSYLIGTISNTGSVVIK
jgi:phosphoribosylformylglycinamidine cyclo-ligase